MRNNLTTAIKIPLCFLCHKPVDKSSMCYNDKKTGAVAHIECFIENMEDGEDDTVQCNHIVGLGNDKRGIRLITIKDCELANEGRRPKLKIKQEFKYCPSCGEKL